MPAYNAPVEHMTFLLNEVFSAPQTFAQCPAFEEVSDDLIVAILTEAGKLASEVLAPFNRDADEAGCTLDNGSVRTAPGTAEAFKAYVEGGWQGLSLPAEFGGQGLPKAIQFLVDEMISGAWLSFGLFPGLTRGAVEAIEAHGSAALKEGWLPQLVSGEVCGTMCLTEAQAGTDLALVRTKAEPADGETFTITGSKIFITAGDHDLTQNIVHLVLARLPDAPKGVKGISLFLVPKILPDGTRNSLSVGALEHKMGIKSSPTCVMNFDGATGWLIGQPHQGLAAMFTMMNTERLFVGVQGVGAAEAAYQGAVAYAKDRLQGRDAGTGAAAHIIAHADVRRMLLTARAWAEGMRALALWTAMEFDASQHATDPARKLQAADMVALMTPVVKAAGTDFGLESAIAAQQVFGGHGYIREWGMEQLVRDVRITQIYEGTNGVQAMDLVGRKISMKDGAVLEALLSQIDTAVEQARTLPDLKDLADAVNQSVQTLRASTAALKGQMGDDPYAVSAAAVPYLRQMALVSQGWMWLKMTSAALNRPVEDPLRTSTLSVASFFHQRLLPEAESLAVVVGSGSKSVMGLPVELF